MQCLIISTNTGRFQLQVFTPTFLQFRKHPSALLLMCVSRRSCARCLKAEHCRHCGLIFIFYQMNCFVQTFGCHLEYFVLCSCTLHYLPAAANYFFKLVFVQWAETILQHEIYYGLMVNMHIWGPEGWLWLDQSHDRTGWRHEKGDS